MDRNKVYEAIDSERRHQDLKWGTIDQHPHEVGSWILILSAHVKDAMEAYAETPNDHGALEEIRKVAAIAVACMEQHGARPRHITEFKGSARETPARGQVPTGGRPGASA